MSDKDQTPPSDPKFDRVASADDALSHERRWRLRRGQQAQPENGHPASPKTERRVKKERRRRIDPTTFEKQYTEEELEFMNAMQRFKVQTGKSFPSHGEVLMVAQQLGYRKDDDSETPTVDGPTDR